MSGDMSRLYFDEFVKLKLQVGSNISRTGKAAGGVYERRHSYW